MTVLNGTLNLSLPTCGEPTSNDQHRKQINNDQADHALYAVRIRVTVLPPTEGLDNNTTKDARRHKEQRSDQQSSHHIEPNRPLRGDEFGCA